LEKEEAFRGPHATVKPVENPKPGAPEPVRFNYKPVSRIMEREWPLNV
jgi:hypothetical protein